MERCEEINGRKDVSVDLNVLTAELSQVVAVYEVEDLAPQRAIEVILSMFNRVTEPLPALLERISALVAAWEEGERSDVDVLATISALLRPAGYRRAAALGLYDEQEE